jgi:endonuclease/exonuclease/phosphatase (EEP) superfamily protein YafD
MLFLRVCLLLGIAFSFLPLLTRLDPRAALFDAFALQCAAGNAVLVLALLVFRRRLKSYRWWVGAGLVAALWSATAVWPEMTFARPFVADGPALKVVNINIWFKQRDLRPVIDYLSASGADVVGLVEVNAESKAALAPLKSLYPYAVDCVEQGCQEMLLSKLPLGNAFAGRIGEAETHAAEGDVVWQGRTITVTVTHLPVPTYLSYRTPDEAEVPLLPGTPDLWQSRQAAVLARHLAKPLADGAGRIVLGDFNSVPWNPLQRAFRDATGLENRGAWAPSWPSWYPFFARIPIDPVFTGGALVVRRLKVGPDVGSDHRPVEAEITVTPE